MGEMNLESVIDKTRNSNGKFNLDTDLKDFAEGIKYEVDIPLHLLRIFQAHGYVSWKHREFNTIKDLILSYRNGINWGNKSRKTINALLAKYGFHELAPKRYARS